MSGSMAAGLSPDGVRVNAICPGFVATPHQAKFMNLPEERHKIEALHLMPIMAAEDVAEWSGLKNGLHANAAETSAVMAINPALVDLDKANAEFPPFPEYTIANTGAVHTAFFFSAPGSVFWATKSGTWGDARSASADKGERYLEVSVRSTLAVLENIEKTFTAMPPR